VVLQSFVPAWGTPFLERVAAHERVHVLQEDQLMHTLVGPGTEWLLRQLPYGSTVASRVDINLSTQLLGLLTRLFPTHIDRPWELEAVYLSR
ncbi:MAG TPA: hypothetical protein VK864_18925, partial [Longimicrobiales bacterium]|nr:hypothetical protein [Longimicrobiales bacterium]